MITVFISYSHKDEGLRNELENHLALLKRSAVIDTWHDRRIIAGAELDQTINSQMECASIFLLLISASFLASDYCYDVEMRRALARHVDGSAIVIPVILRPCDWQASPFGKLLATPTDGKAVTMYANQDEAFAIIAKDIRRAAEKLRQSAPQSSPEGLSQQVPQMRTQRESTSIHRSSNLRIKKKFNDQERDDFLENVYEYMARYFEGSLAELKNRNLQTTTKFKRLDANSFSASIYVDGKRVAGCSISSGAGGFAGGDGIRYSSSLDAPRNSWNEQLMVGDDGYTLHLKAAFARDDSLRLTEQGASEMYWSMLIKPLQ